MIVNKSIEVDGRTVKYEVVIRNELTVEPGDAVHRYELIVHDPELAGGRREGFLCHPDKVPMNHVVIGSLAFR